MRHWMLVATSCLSSLVACASPGHRRELRAAPAPIANAGLDPALAPDAAERHRAVAALCGGAGECVPVACDVCTCACREPWQFRATLPIWVPSISGSFGSGGTTIDADRGGSGIDGELSLVSETATELDFFFVGRFAARKGPWSIVAEGYYADITQTIDWRVRDQDAAGSLAAGIFRAYGAWQSCSPLGDSPCAPMLAVGPAAGVRVYSIDIDVDPATGPSIARSKIWVDPIIGIKADLTFANGAEIRTIADLSGVIAGSDLSWSFAAELSWPLGRGWSVEVGWTILDIDYETGTGADQFGVNLHLSGPNLSFSYEF
jgi:hypothetical protein